MFKYLVVLSIVLFSSNLFAKDYGVMGHTYKIKEENALTYIQNKLKKMEENGEIAKFQEEFKQKTIERTKRPKPVDGLTYAAENKKYYFDPSIILNKNYQDQNGRIFALAGTKVNPLNLVSLRNNLIFIDGDSKEQVEWAMQQYKKYNSFVKIILVKGAIIDLMNQLKTRLYFDQGGTLINHFNIKHVPALVTQENKQLLIEEVALDYEN
jgi:conjugal transfer pilus assembly protein TraW